MEVDGDFIRILGRKSELINVAGEKVHPTEVEDVLLQLDNVRDATVSAKPNSNPPSVSPVDGLRMAMPSDARCVTIAPLITPSDKRAPTDPVDGMSSRATQTSSKAPTR